MLALLLLPAERFALSPCAAAFPVRHALLRCSEEEPEPAAAGALSRAQNLESLLSLAVQTERYEEAARLRDELASLGVDTELAVLEANNQFYRSFSDADLQARVAAHACALALRTLCATQALSPSNRPGTPLCTHAVRTQCACAASARLSRRQWASCGPSTTLGCSLRYIWLQAMDELWAPEGVVTCTHPGHAPLNGREEIMASWQSILGAGARVSSRTLTLHPDPTP